MTNRDDHIDLDDLAESRGQAGLDSPSRAEQTGDAVDAITDDDLAQSSGRGEGTGQAKEVAGLSQGQIVRTRFLRHKGAMAGLVTLALVVLLAFSAMGLGPIPGWWKYQTYWQPNPVLDGGSPTLGLPRWLGGSGLAWGEHPFGQNEIGYDNFAGVMQGVQTSVFVMLVMGAITLLVGVTVGSLAGYYRGRADMVLMRLTDMVITLPVIVIGAVLGKLVYTVPDKLNVSQSTKDLIRDWMPLELAVALGLIIWPGMARLVRSEFLSLREREFVDSARVAGASSFRIITKHILPNAMGVIIVNVTLLMSSAVVLESALSYLGFGITQPNVSLGLLIQANQGAFSTRPWLFWWPGLFIILIALSINFIGDGLRDAFDPRQKKVPSRRELARADKLRETTPGPRTGTGATAAPAPSPTVSIAGEHA